MPKESAKYSPKDAPSRRALTSVTIISAPMTSGAVTKKWNLAVSLGRGSAKGDACNRSSFLIAHDNASGGNTHSASTFWSPKKQASSNTQRHQTKFATIKRRTDLDLFASMLLPRILLIRGTKDARAGRLEMVSSCYPAQHDKEHRVGWGTRSLCGNSRKVLLNEMGAQVDV